LEILKDEELQQKLSISLTILAVENAAERIVSEIEKVVANKTK